MTETGAPVSMGFPKIFDAVTAATSLICGGILLPLTDAADIVELGFVMIDVANGGSLGWPSVSSAT